jgi:hypothetical protein
VGGGAGDPPPPTDYDRITIWHKTESRKLSGNSAPFRKNVDNYLYLHPEWEVYTGQDQRAKKRRAVGEAGRDRIMLWHRTEMRKIDVDHAPLRASLEHYLKDHPHWEVYIGQDKDDIKALLPPPPSSATKLSASSAGSVGSAVAALSGGGEAPPSSHAELPRRQDLSPKQEADTADREAQSPPSSESSGEAEAVCVGVAAGAARRGV